MKVALLFATILSVARTAIEADKMTFLPVPLSETGENVTLKDSMYSGYLNISETKSLHYVFVGSRSENAATDPVVIWFNGGPGCSSLLGLFQEHGPMVIEDNTTALIENPYPWNKEANMLYLESPAGVGFSVNTNESLAPAFSDMSQSIDAFAALEVWYAGFSEFMANPLFVSGESYAGVYVPYLSWQIYENNLKAEWNTTLKTYNLTGFLVGNGCTNWDFDTAPSDPETFANMQLIPPQMLRAYQEGNCVEYAFWNSTGDNITQCDELYSQMNTLIKDLNIYDLFRWNIPDPSSASGEDRLGSVMIGGEEKVYKRGYTAAEYTPWLKHNPFLKLNLQDDPFVFSTFLTDYINNVTTREAMHIPNNVQAYEQCSNTVGSAYVVQREGSEWIYKVLRGAGIRMMHYSGDTDGAVPTYGTKRWIQTLNWPVIEEWRPWMTVDQVSGYTEEYEGLRFTTVKGVGHMAPQWARQPVQEMVTAWIHDKPF